MQELEKILEEIDEIYVDDIGCGVDCNLQGRSKLPCDNCYECIKDVCKDIIRKHMNDGWIPVEERLPEKPKETPVFDGKELELYLVDIGANYPLRAFWNGQKFTDGWSVLNVKAWQPLPKRYRPERKCEIE